MQLYLWRARNDFFLCKHGWKYQKESCEQYHEQTPQCQSLQEPLVQKPRMTELMVGSRSQRITSTSFHQKDHCVGDLINHSAQRSLQREECKDILVITTKCELKKDALLNIISNGNIYSRICLYSWTGEILWSRNNMWKPTLQNKW